jgi:hypothetical protein
MAGLTPVAHCLGVLRGVVVGAFVRVVVLGGFTLVVGWAVGGFPTPDGTGATLAFFGIGVALAAEAGLSVASRRG